MPPGVKYISPVDKARLEETSEYEKWQASDPFLIQTSFSSTLNQLSVLPQQQSSVTPGSTISSTVPGGPSIDIGRMRATRRSAAPGPIIAFPRTTQQAASTLPLLHTLESSTLPTKSSELLGEAKFSLDPTPVRKDYRHRKPIEFLVPEDTQDFTQDFVPPLQLPLSEARAPSASVSTYITTTQSSGSSSAHNVRSSEGRAPFHPSLSLDQQTTQPDFSTVPAIDVLCRMTEKELSAVSNFQIHRPSIGSVVWRDPVDLRGLVLDQVVRFGKESNNDPFFEIYEEQQAPPYGHQLNKAAEVTFVNYYPEPNLTDPEVVKRLKAFYQKDPNFISYDEKFGEFRFRWPGVVTAAEAEQAVSQESKQSASKQTFNKRRSSDTPVGF
jgi:hypothetical protein